METKTKNLIDKSNFTTNINIYKYLTIPDSIIIEDDILIYKKPYQENGSVLLDIVLYDLNKNEHKTLETVTNIPNENIGNLSMDNGLIVWNKLFELPSTEFPKYNFSYENYNIYTYDIKSELKDSFKIDDECFYYSPYIFNNKIALVKIFKDHFFYSEIAIYDLNNKNIDSVINQNTIPNKDYIENIKGNPKMNKDFLIWSQDYYGNNLVYDIKRKEFIKIIPNDFLYEKQYYINPYKLWGNKVYIKGVIDDKPINSIYIIK